MYRPTRDRVLAGVCAGIANHFNLSLTGTRIVFILAAIFQLHLAVICYVVAVFVIPKEKHLTMNCESTNHEPPPPPPTDAVLQPHLSERTVEELEREFMTIENRIQQLEDHVTSKDYILRKKFEEL